MQQLTDFFKHRQVQRILDVGTGTGDFLAVLKNVFPQAEFTAVDPLEASLNEAVKKFPDVRFQKMVAEKLEFDDDSFDVAAISMALHHLSDIDTALAEMKRVIKPGGWIIINELVSDGLNAAQQVHKMLHHLRSKIDRMTGEVHNETFTKAAVKEVVTTAGIKILFQFEDDRTATLTTDIAEVEEKVEKLVQHIGKIAGTPEYHSIQPKIEEFRKAALQNGFQQATRIVLVGTV
jgi:ubiquinone/menaquinone biosynthesis C-methylase UbiE